MRGRARARLRHLPKRPLQHPDHIRWQLGGYEPDGEGEPTVFPIRQDQLAQIRDMLDRGKGWTVDWYPVEDSMWPRLIEVLGCPPPDDRLCYFLEHAEDEP
jgi:hypothetical protein